ncbi:aldehyde dehydrogenase family protein [Bdellovibrio bacteriovorus]|uniref:aldehyde dehydrogenase family protein n=1 Tax=Bdellovibrio bacteriovorus TaxID=959 RepID=UPI0035A6365C
MFLNPTITFPGPIQKKNIEQAAKDFQIWRKVSFKERSEVLLQLAQALRTHKSELAQMMNQEMGKLIAEGKAEVEKCAVTCEHYAKEAETMLKNQVAASSPV